MWVLDARYKAEKIWYSFIWEKAKENPDVIDYNINEEVTKDTSAVFNANNDTTTGMATVIPWVNAPKLIAQTSIYWIDWDAWYVGGVKLRLRTSAVNNVPWYENTSVYLNYEFGRSGERWPYKFSFVPWKWLVIPSQWTYKLECVFYPLWWWSSWFEAKYQVIFRWEVMGTTGTSDYNENLTVTISWKKWEAINFLARLYNGSPNMAEVYPSVDVTVTKL